MAKAAIYLIVLVVCIGLILAAVERGHCYYAGYSMNRDTHYAPFIGCLVESGDGKRIPLSALREVE